MDSGTREFVDKLKDVEIGKDNSRSQRSLSTYKVILQDFAQIWLRWIYLDGSLRRDWSRWLMASGKSGSDAYDEKSWWKVDNFPNTAK